MNWLRPSAVEGWRRLSSHLCAHPNDTLEKALIRLNAGYASAGFDYTTALEIFEVLGPSVIAPAQSYRHLVEEVAQRFSPPWLLTLPRGRALLNGIVSADTLDCFSRAGLMTDSPDQEAVELLDRLANLARKVADLDRVDSGRRAERLSFDLERERCEGIVGAPKPEWTALDDNHAGYDILSSYLEHDRIAPKLVEVKSSRTSAPRLILTRYEWTVATRNPRAWTMHFWDLRYHTLTELIWQDLAPHIPVDQGAGSWDSVTVQISGCTPRSADL